MPDPSEGARHKEFTRALFDLRAAQFGQCFAPPALCKNPPIRAHSLQNARVLELLAKDGHVITPTMRLQLPDPPIIEFKPVGRKKASTFLGLCSQHDHKLFAPIETQPIDTEDPEHLFLLAYRAAYFEVHATSAAAWMLQKAYMKRVELGYDPRGEPSKAGMMAVQRMAIAYDTYRYKQLLDLVADRRTFNDVHHDVFVHEIPRPTIAACVLFSLDGLWNGDDVVRVCLNILPLSATQTAVVFSYIKQDAGLARAELDSVLRAQGSTQLYEVSRRLVNYSQNFVLAPDYVAAWSPTKHDVLLTYFRQTAIHSDLSFEHEDLYLF